MKVQADFNGLFQGGTILCLAHSDIVRCESGEELKLTAGMQLTAFDLDQDDAGNPDNLLASGTVEPSPDWLNCHGSRWILRIDENGVRHESDLRSA